VRRCLHRCVNPEARIRAAHREHQQLQRGEEMIAPPQTQPMTDGPTPEQLQTWADEAQACLDSGDVIATDHEKARATILVLRSHASLKDRIQELEEALREKIDEEEKDAAFVERMVRRVLVTNPFDQIVKFDECDTAEPTVRQMIRQYYIQGLQPDTELALKTADRFIAALQKGTAK
jgi:hypothetical protein